VLQSSIQTINDNKHEDKTQKIKKKSRASKI